ncbi:MAG: hypothetical protein M1814_004025 [Vezdaea aestivalis]|nr:MAG: hypothetical protein M1814_004025 [Vezdaea aestivalis]
MASPAVQSQLGRLKELAAGQQQERAIPETYKQAITEVLKLSDSEQQIASLNATAAVLLGDDFPRVTARPLLSSFIDTLGSLSLEDTKQEVGQHILTLIQSRAVSFEEQDAKLRLLLADSYESQEDWAEAAKVLQNIQLESSQRRITDEEKVEIWIRIIRCLLENDDTTSAETYLNRTKNVIGNFTNTNLNLHLEMSKAKISDAQRNFLSACSSYYSLSLSPLVAEDDRLQSLSAAMKCAILAPAGPQRSRTLGRLYKDERASQVEEFSILEKIFFDRLLSPIEVETFSKNLQPHQLAKIADGSTVLAKAVIEHNLLGASRLYENIHTKDLGILLDLSAEQAEGYAARMIEQGRLVGRIDQIDQLIFFDGVEGTGEKSSAGQAHRTVGKELRRWDSNVQGLSEEVERVTTLLQNEYPEFVAANLVR